LIRTKKTETRSANEVKKTKKKSIVPWACPVQEAVDSEWQMLKLFIISMLHSLAGYDFLGCSCDKRVLGFQLLSDVFPSNNIAYKKEEQRTRTKLPSLGN
jgi:hypothetical protein